MKKTIIAIAVGIALCTIGVLKVSAGLKKSYGEQGFVDHICLSQCIELGYGYSYCRHVCSY